MEKCPVCNARYSGNEACRRCKVDLGPLLKVEQRADEHFAFAVAAQRRGDLQQMRHHAGRAVSLKTSRKSLALLCEAAILTREFPLAARCMKQMAGTSPA